jgi:hypothetical protein
MVLRVANENSFDDAGSESGLACIPASIINHDQHANVNILIYVSELLIKLSLKSITSSK